LSLFTVFGIALPCSTLQAEEPFQQFLDSLRERNYYDAALDYLAEMSRSNLASPDIKSRIPLEEGLTLIQDAQAEKDSTQKQKKLDAATKKLDDFVKANSAHAETPNARMQLGNVVVERGRMLAELATRPSQNAASRAKLQADARKLFDDALKVFSEAETNFKTELDAFPKFIEPNNKELIDKRDVARRNYIQAMLYAAAAAYEKAKTYDEKDKTQVAAHKKGLQEAADKYEKVYQNFRTRLAGLLARIKQGQCYQEMGDTRRALGYYADILNQPDDLVEFRRLKASALYLSLQCWLADSEKKYELAMLKGDEWLRTARGLEDRQADWLAIRYYTAMANKAHAKVLDPDGKGAGNDGARAAGLIKAAVDHANKVAKISGPYQDPAKALLKELGGDRNSDKEPATFVEASERGKVELDKMTEAQTAAKDAKADPSQAAKVQELLTAASEHREKSMHYFDLALSLRESDSEQDEVTNVRYYLCYLRYLKAQFYDAAVMGEFIARNYPDNGGARQAAKIALACYLQSYNDKTMPIEMRAFDRQKMVEVAEYCAKRWAEEEETIDNWSILMAVAVGDRDMKAATEFLNRIPEKSARRGSEELKLGQAYWSEYLRETQKEEGERMTQADLEKLLTEATSWLEKGMARLQAGTDASGPTLELVAAALSASQIYVGSGAPDKALALLENKAYGPLTLVKKNDPVTQQHDIGRETYKVALRAYVAASKIDEAKAMMEGLKSTVAPERAGDLTIIYISMGRALEEQVNTLRAAGKTDELKKTTEGFEVFLREIAKSADGNTFASLNWVAETFYSLGAGFDTPGVKLPKEAEDYYNETLASDKRLLDEINKPGFFPESPDKAVKVADALTAVKLRTARCLRRLNKFKESVDLLESILKEKGQLLDAQTEAAYAYMDWGAAENPLYYNLAMFGARKDAATKQNIIWGWVKMGSALSGNPQFEKVYHESRLNLARCHLAQAQLANAENKLDKKQLLDAAYQDIRFTTRIKDFRKLAADLPDIFAKYDDVYKTIQKARGDKATGLKELLETPKTDSTKAPAVSAAK